MPEGVSVRDALRALFPGNRPTERRLRETLGAVIRAQESSEAWSELLGGAIRGLVESPASDPSSEWFQAPDLQADDLGHLATTLEELLRAFTRARDATESAVLEVESVRMDLLIEHQLQIQRKRAEPDDVSDREGNEGGAAA